MYACSSVRIVSSQCLTYASVHSLVHVCPLIGKHADMGQAAQASRYDAVHISQWPQECVTN